MERRRGGKEERSQKRKAYNQKKELLPIKEYSHRQLAFSPLLPYFFPSFLHYFFTSFPLPSH